uniref:Lipocalin/cytosolic fatty-acid binding domain-containing protein n=1 Tax=Sus scrofa TaxID=9823 RepID=A0A8D1ALD3_PIG
MPPNLTGYYRFVSQKNLEDYLQALNINLALRKIALLLKPDKEINHRGNHMTVKTLSTFRNYVLEFEVGVEFEEDLGIVDGRKCQTIVTWEEEQLVCVQKGEVPNRGWRHWLEGETLYLEPESNKSPETPKEHERWEEDRAASGHLQGEPDPPTRAGSRGCCFLCGQQGALLSAAGARDPSNSFILSPAPPTHTHQFPDQMLSLPRPYSSFNSNWSTHPRMEQMVTGGR